VQVEAVSSTSANAQAGGATFTSGRLELATSVESRWELPGRPPEVCPVVEQSC
jgi:hypothetical protein